MILMGWRGARWLAIEFFATLYMVILRLRQVSMRGAISTSSVAHYFEPLGTLPLIIVLSPVVGVTRRYCQMVSDDEQAD